MARRSSVAARAGGGTGAHLVVGLYKLMLDLVMTSRWTSRLKLDLPIASLALMDDERARPEVRLQELRILAPWPAALLLAAQTPRQSHFHRNFAVLFQTQPDLHLPLARGVVQSFLCESEKMLFCDAIFFIKAKCVMASCSVGNLPVDTPLGESSNIAMLAHNEKVEGTGRNPDEVRLEGQFHHQSLQVMEERQGERRIQLLRGGAGEGGVSWGAEVMQGMVVVVAIHVNPAVNIGKFLYMCACVLTCKLRK